MKPKVNEVLSLKIDRLTYNGGRGIGRHFNLAIFVEGPTSADDLVEVRITQVKKNFAIAQLIKVITPAPQRTEPNCIYYQQCGGCQWQHINYDEQIKQKKAFLAFFLKKIKSTISFKFIPSDLQYNYRNRVQLNFKDNKLGYYQKNSHQLTNIKSCAIARPPINDLIRKFKPTSSSPRYEFAITESGSAKAYPIQEKHQHNLFSQVNNSVNTSLIHLLLDSIHNDQFTAIYDSFCGNGNFTFPMHKLFPKTKITAIDYSHKNILQAQKKESNIVFIESKVEDHFKRKPAVPGSLVVVDPPRNGCEASILKNINNAKVIIYISCDLSTFERDTKILQQEGFILTQLTGLDMFPQTYHLETLAVFKR